MLHNGNRIHGHDRSEESIKLISEYLIKCHEDKDANSLFVRFCELQLRIESLECSLEATWSSLLNTAEQVKILKQKDTK